MNAHTCIRRRFVTALAWLLLCSLAAVAPAQAQPAPQRVVAIADIHADLDAFVAILKQARLLDESGAWVADSTTLVQTGDSIDRGPKMRETLDLLMALEKQAQRKNSRAIALLGNHEVMNIVGDLRYVTAENFASFADKNSEKRRERAWEAYVQWSKDRAKALGQPAPVITKEQMDAEWLKAHPLGFFEHRDAFGPTGKYGKWLRERPAVAHIGDTIFVHGGLQPVLGSSSVEQVNKAINTELKNFDLYQQYLVQEKLILPFFTLEEMRLAVVQELDARTAAIAAKTAAATAEGKTYEVPAAERKANDLLKDFLNFPTWLSIHPGGPLWFRGYAEWPEEEGVTKLEPALAKWGAARIVVGHTPQKDGQIRSRFGNRVFLIDTGMLSAHYTGGRGSALEIESGKVTAIYPDQRVVLLDPAKPAPPAVHSSPPPDLDEHPEYGGGPQGSTAAKAAVEPAKAKSSLAPPARVWLGPEGDPLPFKSDAELMEFLRKASIRSMRDIGQGITRPRKVRLEKDGVQMNAIFRDVHEEKDAATMAGGRRELFFRDDYIFENAAYELALLLGLDNVPPVVTRRINGQDGSLQVWLEQSMTEGNRQKDKIRPPDVIRWNHQIQVMRIFDNLIFNTDRNMGNILIDKNWKLWMIDHTRAFRRFNELREPALILQCERGLLERLKALDKPMLQAALKKYLRQFEIEAILARRDMLVAHIHGLIAEKGEDQVLFSWD